MKKSLLALTIGGFGIGMTEFVMMGILPDIAKSLQITIPQAGHLVSAYALGVVVGAPLLIGISAFATSYPLLMTARFLSGLPHGAFFGVGAVVAGRLAEKGREARAVS